MKLSELLEAQAKHREDISVEKAMELFERHCSDMDFKKPCWRGSKTASEDVYILHGERGSRASANSTNHNTVLMDEFLPKLGFPKRAGSIILESNGGKEYANEYARNVNGKRGLYAVFPFNGVPIGICEDADIWFTEFKIGKSRIARSVRDWNMLFEDAGIPDYSFDDLVAGIQETIENPEDEHYDIITDIFGTDPSLVADILEDTYGEPSNLGVKLITSKDLDAFPGEHELWIGGKCLAIREDIWRELAGLEDDDADI